MGTTLAAEEPTGSHAQHIPWQPAFVNYRDEVLFCAWSIFGENRLIVSRTTDGVTWTHTDAPNAPDSLKGTVTGFPSGHGLLTSRDELLIPCSLPPTGEKGLWIRNPYQAVLRSTDAGRTWHWSQPIQGSLWSASGNDPAHHDGDDAIYHWELSLFEKTDGELGYVARNTSRMPDPKFENYLTVLTGESTNHGLTWTRASPAQIDSVSARPFAAKRSPADGLFVVTNDWVRTVPQPAWNTRSGLSLMLSPVDDPNLLLPGPLVQPDATVACYPNGFIHENRLHLIYTQGRGEYGYANIRTAVIDPLPDFNAPFLLPRDARSGLLINDRIASFRLPESTLGLVLTQELTEKPDLVLTFESRMDSATNEFPLLSIGGKIRNGVNIRIAAIPGAGDHRYQARLSGSDTWQDITPCELNRWNRVTIELRLESVILAINDAAPVHFSGPILRKIAFGGLHTAPVWPRPSKANPPPVITLRLDSIHVR
jgi:hypothetical protein